MTFEDFLTEWRSDVSFILARTSGSTGVPKEVRLPKDFVAESARRTNDFFSIGPGSRLHSCVSPDFIGGKMMLVRAEMAGATLSWEIPSNQPLQNIDPTHIIDLLAVVPSQMIHILDNIGSLPKIRNIIIGGSAIHPQLRKRIGESGLNAFETYGMTETASHIALRRITHICEGEKENPFHVLPGIYVTTDSDGCLQIRFESGKIIVTNDLAEIVSPKEFYIHGRRDHIINSGGKKINPIEVEKKIAHLIPFPFYITGEPDEKWGQRVILVIQSSKYDGSEDPGKSGLSYPLGSNFPESFCHELLDSLRNFLAPHELPKAVRVVSSLPITPSGKLKRT